MLKPFNTKIEDRQIKALNVLSSSTHIPKARLVRQAIDLLIEEHQSDILSDEFMQIVDSSMLENADLLKRLAKG
ncbi:ribbon-helix-helix domain-containing protein [bacterium]|nr:ribbon-helix-helix domain-containing protein [bacterium]